MTQVSISPRRFPSHSFRLTLLLVVMAGLFAPAVAGAQVSYTGSAGTQNFGSVAVSSPSSVSLSYSVSSGTAVGSIEVVTKGAPNLDFTNNGGGTCAVETYSSTTTCTVGVTFTPMYPGTREGAVLFWSGSGNTGTVLNKTLIYGVGAQAGLAYTNSTVTTIGPTLAGGITLQSPNGVSFDGAGNMYIADFGNPTNGAGSQVVEIPAAGGNAVVVSANAGGTALDGAADVQVDGAGDIFIADQDNSRVVELPVGGGLTAFTPTVSGNLLSFANDALPGPDGVLYITDNTNNRLLEIQSLGTGAAAQITAVDGMNLNNPAGLSLDSAGDLFIGDQINNRVAEITAGGGSGSVYGPAISGVSGDLSDAYGVFVDAASNLFITDFTGTGRLIEIPAGTSTGSVLAPNVGGVTLMAPSFMGADNAGNFYVADYGTSRVFKIARTPPVLVATHFSVSAPASSTAGSPLSVTVTALSSSNATVTGYTGTVHFTSTDGLAVLPANATLTNGVGTFNVTLDSAGSQTVTATDTVTVSITGTAGITVNPAAATHLVIPGGPEPFYTAFGITISAYDAFGNVATSYNGTVAFTSSDPGFVNLGPVTLVNGVGSQSAVLKTAGTDSITATDTTNPSITGTGFFTIQPGVATRIGLVAPSSAYVGSPISYTLTAYDLYGNVATSYGGTVVFTSSDPSAVLPGSSTITNGTGTFSATMETVGSQTITATDAGNSLTAQTGNIGVTLPVLVVTTAVDDPGATSNCTIQATPATGTDAACSLRDALLFAANQGSGSITFDSTTFAPTNTTAANTITLSNGVLSIPSNTSIWGATSGSGATLTNLVTVNGNQASTDFYVDYGVSSTSINNLIVTGASCDPNTGITGGGISNQGSLTVAGSTISGNVAHNGLFCSIGGGINNGGTLTVTNSTISGNSAGRWAGGIFAGSGSAMTVTNSTISGNSSEYGGGIYEGNSATLTVTNSTISANSATDDPNAGGGIFNENGVPNLANTIVAANSGGDVFSTYTDNGGNQVGTGFTTTTLGSNGGPTHTMAPQPGDAAICGGTLANATAAGITADQRGFLFDPHCPAGSVDSGAVQSNYGLQFGSVPHTTVAGQAITPAPTTTLLESGMISTAPTSAVTLSDSSSTLSGATTQNLSSGVATFPGVSFTTVGLNTQLIATMALNGSTNLVSTAGTTTTVSPVPAVLTSPGAGTLPGPEVTFSWSPASGATAYSLWIGSTGVGSSNVYLSGAQTVTSIKVGGLPTNGGQLYVRLYTIFNGVATPNDYTFTATTRAAITAPSSPSTFTGPNVSFSWSPASGATGYSLWLGSAGAGSSNLYNSGAITALTATANALPTNGGTIYARINTIYAGGISVSNDYTYTADTAPMATLTSPTPSTTLSGARVTFTWTAGTGATGYSLWIGSAGPGSSNLYVSHAITALTATASGLPTNGAPVYVRLYTLYNGVSRYTDYTYTAAP